MKPYGRIRWIDSYEDAPSDAYILREMGDLTVRLEHYSQQNMEILSEFPRGAFGNLESTLIESRKIMGNKRTIWVERPPVGPF